MWISIHTHTHFKLFVFSNMHMDVYESILRNNYSVEITLANILLKTTNGGKLPCHGDVPSYIFYTGLQQSL